MLKKLLVYNQYYDLRVVIEKFLLYFFSNEEIKEFEEFIILQKGLKAIRKKEFTTPNKINFSDNKKRQKFRVLVRQHLIKKILPLYKIILIKYQIQEYKKDCLYMLTPP